MLFRFPTLLRSVQPVYVAQHFCNVFQLPFTKQNMIWQYNSHKILSIWSSQPPIASKIILIPPRPSVIVSANQGNFDVVYYHFCHDNSTLQINSILFEGWAMWIDLLKRWNIKYALSMEYWQIWMEWSDWWLKIKCSWIYQLHLLDIVCRLACIYCCIGICDVSIFVYNGPRP